jgi:lysophospholipid acyltransferase (LPLAT)-like uncharacterized protein
MLRDLKYFLMLNLLPPVIYLFLSLLKLTLRIEHVNAHHTWNCWEEGKNNIYCFWHGRLLCMPFAFRGKPAKVLISRHRDGEFIARVIRFFGLGAVRGSHRKGGVSSLRTIMGDLKKGIDIAITPDGPKGPRYEVKKGIVELGRLAGKDIVPITYGAGKKKLFTPGTVSLFPTLFPGSSSSMGTQST